MHPPTPPKNPIAIQRTYGRCPSNAVTLGLIHRHHLHTASSADYCFNLGHYEDCAALCLKILRSERLPAEAIQARCHMYLAMSGVGSEDAEERLTHAERAVELWDVVITRKGESRFPIAKAKEEKEIAKSLAEACNSAVLEVQEEWEAEAERMAKEMEEGTVMEVDGEEEGEIVEVRQRSGYFSAS